MKKLIFFAFVACLSTSVLAQKRTLFYALEIDGKPTSLLEKLNFLSTSRVTIGGDLDRDGFPDYLARQSSFTETTFQTELLHDRALLNLIRDTLNGKSERKNGAIVAADFDYKEHRRTVLGDGWKLLRCTFPKGNTGGADGSTNQWPMLGFAVPEVLPGTSTGQYLGDITKPKTWNPSNFRIAITESGVKRNVAAITVTPPVIEDGNDIDEDCDRTLSDVIWTSSNVTLECPLADVGVFQDLLFKHHDIQGLDAPTLELTYFDRNVDGSTSVLACLKMQILVTGINFGNNGAATVSCAVRRCTLSSSETEDVGW